jgi:hypothetical protein
MKSIKKNGLIFLITFYMICELEGQTQEICPNNAIPDKWVIVSLSPNNCGSFQKKLTIKNTTNLTVRSLEVCPNSPIPADWVKAGLSPNQCGIQRKFDLVNTKRVTQKSLEVCPDSPIPAGWVKTGLSPNKCGDFQHKIIIKKV